MVFVLESMASLALSANHLCTLIVQSHCHAFPCITLALLFFSHVKFLGEIGFLWTRTFEICLFTFGRLPWFFFLGYCLIKLGLTSRALLFKEEKQSPRVKYEIWHCVGAMWTDMKMIVAPGWRNGIKNESGKQDLRTLGVLPSNMDIMGF